MLKKRIIPIVLLDGFSVLKTINFKQRRNLGSPVTVLKTYNTRNVDELVLLDIDASKQSRSIDKFIIKEIAQECFMPLTVGGGIRTISEIQDLLKVGADKVCLNSIAFESPDFIVQSSSTFGSQCITVSIDIVEEEGRFYRYSNGIIQRDLDLNHWIPYIEKCGAGEILINNVTRDGLMIGGDKNLAQYISELVNIPVIYAGGISSPEDSSYLADCKVSAVGISSIFHFTDYTPEDCRLALENKGIPVRSRNR